MFKILVVEDNYINQRVITAYLAHENITLLIANNGIEAVNFFNDMNFDCILMDIAMPEMDGIEATKEIRLKERLTRKRTPIIAVTASDPESNRDRFFAAGIDDYLAKPINERILKEKIEKYSEIIF
ncbi:MAG: histidine kinase [Bacteroidetes bacterium HGW-Bacteroidetes-17]|nr:MAG: histidine kinase [Bacteroidetes bacterium HGW-Bacteroidetes-17]